MTPKLEQPRSSGRRQLLPNTTTSGMLLAGASVPVAVLHAANGSALRAGAPLQATAALISALYVISALTIMRRPRIARPAATLATLLALGLGSPQLVRSPLTTLAVLLVGAAGLALLWKVGAPIISLSRVRRRPVCEGQAQGAALVALALWLLWIFSGTDPSLVDTLVVGWAVGTSVWLGLEWALRSWRRQGARAKAVVVAACSAVVAAPLLWGRWWWLMSSLVGCAATVAFVVRPPQRTEMDQGSWWEPLLGHPERLFVGTFAGLSLAGTALLSFPQSASSGQRFALIDAAFTSTSAVCVTGLIVLDTPVDFSPFGQLVVLLLIQVGGLGIMTFSTAALWALGRRMSLRHEGAVASLIGSRDRRSLFHTAQRILVLTMAAEALGAVILTAAFVHHGDALATALWRGVFTSVSAFCNAGFALQSDSLVPYQGSPLVLHVVGLLIVLGGLSPLALMSLPALARRSTEPVPAQVKLGIATTAVLVVSGFFFVLAFEWSDSLGGLSVADRVHNAWFQSVTLRTAGFNSIDIAAVRPATLSVMMLWMFIGGSPGGTAGGVKTTTISVLVLSVVQAIRGQWTLEVFGRRVTERTRTKAAMVVAIAAASGIAALVAIQLTQAMPTRDAAFEVVSALGTVGLSIGGTSKLDDVGKVIIIACMFVGRVGGLTLLMFLSSRRGAPAIGRPEEEIDVG